jgi:predicted O-linked N-acetylglucosamine transferase (SPINDLY family)
MKRRQPDKHDRSFAQTPLLREAVDFHQAGRFAEAAELYSKVLAQEPNHFDATHLLGVIALQQGRLEEARDWIASALRSRPTDSAALSNLGTVYLRQRNYELAHQQFERALKLEPHSSTALTNLGTVLRQMGRSREAVVPLRRAYSSNPNSALVCNLLGACLLDTSDAHAAVELFKAATQADPVDADGWANLAVALNNIGEHDRAREYVDRAIAMRPDSSATVAALAAVEFEQGDIETAIETYREAINLPDASAQTYCAFANALWTGGFCEESIEQLRLAVAMDENNALALWKLAMSQCRPFYANESEVDLSRGAFSEQLAALGTWFHSKPRTEAYSAVGSTQPFFIAYQPFNNRGLLGRYGALCCEWMGSMPQPALAVKPNQAPKQKKPGPGDRIRLGIVSAHIRDHSVWNAITKGWLAQLDQQRFDVWLFHLGRTIDGETERARRATSHFVDRPKNLESWIREIQEARPDVLIYPEIGMDALTTQLASLRLAPVQAATWGHPETTGLPTMDLYLSADALEPADAQDNYTERLVRLPNLGVYLEPLTPSVADPGLASLGLPSDEPLLLCPGTPFKYSPMYDHIWARIAKGMQSAGGGKGALARFSDRLRKRGHGRLVFFKSRNNSMDRLLAQRLRKAFDAEHIDFDAYVCVIPYLDRPQFFGLMQKASLMLDTVGFSGFNNALQAVEAGLPVLAHEGAFMRGRLASSVMRRMGLPELVAATNDDFIETAVRLAFDVRRLSELRTEIINRRTILYHDVGPVRSLEACLSQAVGQIADTRH